jgi:hypothetical protein
MIYIRCHQLHKSRHRIFWIVADWNMQFVRGDKVIFWVAELPPPLMPCDGHVQRCFRPRGILNTKDNSCGGKKQHHHDQDWKYGPCQLNLIASVNLRRLGLIIAGAATEFDDHENQQPAHRNKDGAGNDQNKNGEAENIVRRH